MENVRKKNKSYSNINRSSSLIDYSRNNLNQQFLNCCLNRNPKKINTDWHLKKNSIENYSNLNSNKANSTSMPNILNPLLKNNSPITKQKSLFQLNTSQNKKFNKTFSNINLLKKNLEKAKFYKNSFLKKSKNENISANDIFEHYLNEHNRDKHKLKKMNLTRYLRKKPKTTDFDFKKIYSVPKSFSRRIEEIKKNNIIAYKNDFDIQDYQSTLIKLLKRSVSPQNLENLEKNFSLFNERNFGITIFRGRYVVLANKLKDHLTFDNREKLKMLDKVYRKFINQEEFSKKI